MPLPTNFVYLCVNLKAISIMKKDMKKLLVIVMALMPSLSILAYAQENGGGFDPDDHPIQSSPGPNNPGPRIMMQGIDPDEILIKQPSDPTPRPRIMSASSTDDNSAGPIDLGLSGVRPRNRQDIDPSGSPESRFRIPSEAIFIFQSPKSVPLLYHHCTIIFN